MLIVEDQPHFDSVVAFAKEQGFYETSSNDSLKSRLDYLEQYGGSNGAMRVRLQRDFAPQSFFFIMEKKSEVGEWSTLFVGGLIYHGAIDGHGSGSAPTFAVTLTPCNGWSIHT